MSSTFSFSDCAGLSDAKSADVGTDCSGLQIRGIRQMSRDRHSMQNNKRPLNLPVEGRILDAPIISNPPDCSPEYSKAFSRPSGLHVITTALLADTFRLLSVAFVNCRLTSQVKLQ